MSATGAGGTCGCCGGSSTSHSPCGCCEGVVPITPVTLWNPPGLSAVKYRVGTYGQFRETMVSALSSYPALLSLGTRADDDLTIGLLDSFAAVGDVLSFYQERIANEGYLRTATERSSILQLAREIGYELGPGVAASASLAFTIDASGSVASTLIGAGTKVQSVPLHGKTPPEMPQTFETIQSIVAYPEFNSLAPLTTTVQTINDSNIDGLASIVLSGTNARLQTGDHLLVAFVQDRVVIPVALKTVYSVAVDQAAKQTTVSLVLESARLDYASVQELPTANASGASTGAEKTTSPTQIDADYVKQLIGMQLDYSQLKAMLTRNGWDPSDFASRVNSLASMLRSPVTAKVFALRAKAGIFGNSAQPWNTLASILTDPSKGAYRISWEDAAINTDSQGNPNDGGNLIYLDNRYPAITPESWIVLKNAERTIACSVASVLEKSLADFDMSSKVTGLSLDRSIFLIPTSGPPDTLVLVNGYGFPPNTLIDFVLNDGNVTLASLQTDEQGSFGNLATSGVPWYSLWIPSTLSNGPATISARDNQGNILASCVFVVFEPTSPSIFVVPTIRSDGKIWVYGYGFPPLTFNIYLWYDDKQFPPLYQWANATNGSFDNWTDFWFPAGTTVSGPVTISYKDAARNVVTSCVFENSSAVDSQQLPFMVRDTAAFADSEELVLADVSIRAPLSGTNVTLDHFAVALQEKQALALTGQLADQPGVQATEVVSIEAVIPFAQIDSWGNSIPPQIPLTAIQLSDPGLVNSYDPKTVTINANVALATHGETKNEAVGSGDPTQPYLEFSLKQKPLTYVRPIPPASSPTGGVTTLQVWVDDIKWTEATSLYGLAPNARSYIVRRDDDGTVNVLFGNARPAVGIENITAQYRVGTGLSGEVAAGQLSLLVSRPLGVRSVTNPLAADGAGDPEDRDHARVNAPITVLTLDRIVSLTDVQNFALAFAGIGKALAQSSWKGESRVVSLYVASSAGQAVAKGSTLYDSLSSAISQYKDPSLEVVIDDTFQEVHFSIQGTLLVGSDRDPNTVGQAVVLALQQAFSFAARQLGQPVHLSDVLGVIQGVDGVVAVELKDLTTQTGQSGDLLTCGLNELLAINPDPDGISLETKAVG